MVDINMKLHTIFKLLVDSKMVRRPYQRQHKKEGHWNTSTAVAYELGRIKNQPRTEILKETIFCSEASSKNAKAFSYSPRFVIGFESSTNQTLRNCSLMTLPVFWMIPESTSSRLLWFLPAVCNVSKLNTVPEIVHDKASDWWIIYCCVKVFYHMNGLYFNVKILVIDLKVDI